MTEADILGDKRLDLIGGQMSGPYWGTNASGPFWGTNEWTLLGDK